MKKIFLAIAICTAAFTGAKAQLTKGNMFVGADLGTTSYSFGTQSFNYSSAGSIQNDNNKTYSLDFAPSMGVFLTNHLVFGGTLDLSYSHISDNITNTNSTLVSNESKSDNTTVTLGPFLRYYFFDSTPSKTVFYIQASGLAGSGSGSSSGSDEASSESPGQYSSNISNEFVIQGSGSLGITHFISKDIGLDLAIGYTYDYEHYTDTYNTNPTTPGSSGSYKASIPKNGIGINAGFHFFLP